MESGARDNISAVVADLAARPDQAPLWEPVLEPANSRVTDSQS